MKTPRKYPGYPTKNISNKNREIIWIIRFFSRKMKNKSIDHLNLAISSVTRNSLDSDPEILFWKWTTCLWLSFSKCNMSLVRHPGSKSQVDLSNFAREIQPTSWTLVVDLHSSMSNVSNWHQKIAILQKKDTHFFQHSSFSVPYAFVKIQGQGQVKEQNPIQPVPFKGMVYWVKFLATHTRVHATAPGTVWTWPLVSARDPCGDLEIWGVQPSTGNAGSWQMY